MFFVYVRGLRGPEPQKWIGKPVNGSGVAKPALQQHELSDGLAELTLEELQRAFPYNGEKN